MMDFIYNDTAQRDRPPVFAGHYFLGLATTILTFFLLSCTSVTSNSSKNNEDNGGEEWLIPKNKVFRGAGKDQIASIDDPTFSEVSEIDFLDDEDLVLGLKMGDQVKAYPHNVLNYHEIANDEINNIPIAVTFCPLTGSGLTWERIVKNGTKTTFGVSGLIYKNNLIAYDRETNSRWSQMLVQSVNGPLKGRRPPKVYHGMIEMTWGAWKKAYPNSKILNGTKLLQHAYDENPYGEDYPTNNEKIIFPIGEENDQLERKALLHGIYYTSSLLVFQIEKFSSETSVINHFHANNKVVVAGNSRMDLAVSYSRVVDDGTVLEFSRTDDPLPVIMEDNEGNKWNVFGEAVAGPREGAQLNPVPSYNAYWFAWVDFFGRSEKDPQVYIQN